MKRIGSIAILLGVLLTAPWAAADEPDEAPNAPPKEESADPESEGEPEPEPESDPDPTPKREPAQPAILKIAAEMKCGEKLVRALAFHPDGTVLATSGRDRTLRLWRVATGKTQASVTVPPTG